MDNPLTGLTEGNPNDRDDDRGQDRSNRIPSRAESARAAALRLEEIHQYLTDRYARRHVVARTTTRGGLELDWVPVESQLREGKLADPPDHDSPVQLDQGAQRAELVRFELEHDGSDLGPKGTVPLVRKPIERIRPTVGLNDWLAKGIRA